MCNLVMMKLKQAFSEAVKSGLYFNSLFKQYSKNSVALLFYTNMQYNIP